MMVNKTNLFYVGFAILLLLIVNNIRSGVLVDTSFLPRFLSLTVLLLVATWLLFKKRTVVNITFFEIAFLLFYLWNLLSALWAVVPSEALVQSQLVFLSFSVYLVITVLLSRNDRFEKIFIAVSFIAVWFSFILAFHKMSVLEFFDPYRMNSVSANNNLYAGYLLIFLPLAFSGYSVFKGFLKYLSAATGILTVFFIVITQSRAAYLGLFFGTLILLTILLLRYRVLFTRKNLLAAGLSLLLLSAGVFTFFSSLDAPRKSYFLSKIPVWQYFRSYEESPDVMRINRQKEKAQLTGIPEFDFAGSYYENASLRIIFWKKSASLIASHPLVGTGAGNWRIEVPSVAKPDNPDHTFKNFTYSQPHNEWIGFLAELGIPGLFLAIIIFFLPVLIVLYRVVVKRQEIHVGSVFYCAFLAGFYLYACFDFPFKRIEHNVMVFSILAFLLHKNVIAGKVFNPGPGLWKWFRFFLVGGLLFTILVLTRRISGEYYTLLMFRNEGKNNEKVIFYGQKAGSWFYRLTPNTLPLDWFVGVAQFKSGDSVSAGSSFQNALKVTPYEVRVLNDHAISLYKLGRPDEAKSELKKTIALDPFFDDARFNLAAILYFNGQPDSARILVQKCRESQKKIDFLSELK